MSKYTPCILNGSVLLVAGVWLIKSEGYDKLGPVLLTPLVVVLANGLVFFKAVLRREAGLALIYFLVVLAAAVLFTNIKVPGKIGG